MTTRHLQRVRNLIYGNLQLVGQLLRRRTTLVLLLELREGLANLVQRTHLIEGQTHDTRLLCQSLKDGLTNPPYSITDEFESTRLIKFLSSLNQAQVTLVDQVGQAQTLVLILLGYRDHKTQIGTGQFLQRHTVTLTDALGQFHLFLDRNQVFTSNFLQIFIERSTLSVCDTLCNFKLSHALKNRFWLQKYAFFLK